MEFDEESTLAELRRLPANYQGTFAIACAHRLLPVFENYWGEHGIKEATNPSKLAQLLQEAWSSIIFGLSKAKRLFELADEGLALLQDDEDRIGKNHPYVEEAVASAVYALKALDGAGPENALLSARRVYEALDNYVIHEFFEDDDTFDEATIQGHELIQAELVRQKQDLDELRACFKNQDELAKVAQHLKEKATISSAHVFKR